MTPQRRYTLFSSILLGLLLVYLLLRAGLNDTLHDEYATFFFYIYHGDFWGDTIVWDANNHLLNSVIGHLMYPLVKDNFFWLRLPNVLSFILYFWSCKLLLQFLRAEVLKYMGLLAIATVPFVLEYFAYTRGYGMSLAFFFYALYHLLKFLKEGAKTRSLLYCFLFLWLAVSANLTLINSSLLIIGFVALLPFFKRQTNHYTFSKTSLPALLALLSLLPLIAFAFALKEAGALYYGAKDGLWDITGKSLSDYTLYLPEMYSAILVGGILTALVVGFVILAKRYKFDFIANPYFLLAYILFGNLIGFVILAELMQVNYPEDRTGMYLIPLFVLLLTFGIEAFNKTLYASIFLLYFPLSLLFNLNLNSSVFSPDQRLPEEVYKKVKKELKPENTLMIYKIIGWNWPKFESKESLKSTMYNSQNPNDTLADYILAPEAIYTNNALPRLYDTLCYDESSSYLAYKRKTFLPKTLVHPSELATADTREEFFTLHHFENLGELSGQPLQISVSGHLETFQPKNKLQLVLSTFDAQGRQLDYEYYPFETVYQGQIIKNDFRLNFLVSQLPAEAHKISVYLWNRNEHHYKLQKGKCYLYKYN